MDGRKHWFFEFVVKDWMTAPDVSLLKDSTRGIWFDALCCMFLNDRCGQLVGSLAELAVLCRTTPNNMRAAIADIKQRNAADVTERDGIVTLENRRMRRDFVCRKSARERKLRERDKKGGADVTRDVTPESQPLNHNQPNLSTPQPPGDLVGFGRFWEAWPQHFRKVNKPVCLIRWKTSGCESIVERILLSLDAWKRCEQWSKDAGKFICAPLTWLNQARWDAANPPTAKTGQPNVSGPEATDKLRRDREESLERDKAVIAYLSEIDPTSQDILIAEYKRECSVDKPVTQSNNRYRAWVYDRIKPEVAA